MSDEYTEAELAGLSEEERQAVLAVLDNETDTGEDDGADDLLGDGGAEGDDAGKVAGADTGAKGAEAIDTGAGAEGEVKPEVIGVDLADPAGDITANHVRLPEAVAAEYQARLDALATKFYDGEIEMGDMLDERDKINREIYNAEVELTEQNKAAREWSTAQDKFFKDNGIYLSDAKRYEDLNTFVKAIAAKEDSKSFADVLAKAARMEQALNGAYPAGKKDEAADAGAGKGKSGKLPPSARPAAPNLADIPAAAGNETNAGEFASLDGLTGEAYEAALGKLSETQLERYLNS